MMKNVLIMVIGAILLQSSPLFAGTTHSPATVEAAGQAATEYFSTHPLHANADSEKEMIACTEPRPQVCSQDYRPVCANLADGSFKTFSNGCNACSDPAVTGYREGACE